MTFFLVIYSILILLIKSLETFGDWTPLIAEYHIQWSATSSCEIPWETDPVPQLTFPFGNWAAVGEQFLETDRSGCGRCYELRCTSVTDPNGCACKSDTVVIAALDLKGAGDFDLTSKAYNLLSTDPCNGKLNIDYRRVSCDYQTGIKITQMTSDNAWNWEFRFMNVARNGEINRVQMKSSATNSAYTDCTRSLGKWYCNTGIKPYVWPLSLKLYQTGAANSPIEAVNIINTKTLGAFWTQENFISSTSGSNTNSPTKSSNSVTNNPTKKPVKEPTNNPSKKPTNNGNVCGKTIKFDTYYGGQWGFAFKKQTTFNDLTNAGYSNPSCSDIKVKAVEGTQWSTCEEFNGDPIACNCNQHTQITNQINIDIENGDIVGIVSTNGNLGVGYTYSVSSNNCNTNTNKPTNKPITDSPTNKVISNTNNPTLKPTNKPTSDPSSKPTNKPTNNPNGNSIGDIPVIIKLYYGSGDWYLAFIPSSIDTQNCVVDKIQIRPANTDTWYTCGITSESYTCSGAKFGTNGAYSIDMKIYTKNGGIFEAYNIEWQGNTYAKVINFGKSWDVVCDSSYLANGESSKVGVFDFKNYSTVNWGIFITILILLILLIIGIIFIIIKRKNKNKENENDIEFTSMVDGNNTIQSNIEYQTLN